MNLGTRLGRDTKYFHTLELYWHMKIVMGHSYKAQGKDHREALLQLDKVLDRNKGQRQCALLSYKLRVGYHQSQPSRLIMDTLFQFPPTLTMQDSKLLIDFIGARKIFFFYTITIFSDFYQIVLNSLRLEPTILIIHYGLLSLSINLEDISSFFYV